MNYKKNRPQNAINTTRSNQSEQIESTEKITIDFKKINNSSVDDSIDFQKSMIEAPSLSKSMSKIFILRIIRHVSFRSNLNNDESYSYLIFNAEI